MGVHFQKLGSHPMLDLLWELDIKRNLPYTSTYTAKNSWLLKLVGTLDIKTYGPLTQ